jgi:hypothetical protein
MHGAAFPWKMSNFSGNFEPRDEQSSRATDTSWLSKKMNFVAGSFV